MPHTCHEASVFLVGQCLAPSVSSQKCQGSQCLLLLLIGFYSALCHAGLQFFHSHISKAFYFTIILGLKESRKNVAGEILLLIDFEAGFHVSQAALELFL